MDLKLRTGKESEDVYIPHESLVEGIHCWRSSCTANGQERVFCGGQSPNTLGLAQWVHVQSGHGSREGGHAWPQRHRCPLIDAGWPGCATLSAQPAEIRGQLQALDLTSSRGSQSAQSLKCWYHCILPFTDRVTLRSKRDCHQSRVYICLPCPNRSISTDILSSESCSASTLLYLQHHLLGPRTSQQRKCIHGFIPGTWLFCPLAPLCRSHWLGGMTEWLFKSHL